MRSVLVALLVVFGIASARADIVYTVVPFELFGTSGDAHLTGTITTDGVMGTITPADIVSWQITDVELFGIFQGATFTAGSALGSAAPTWTPGAVTATESGQLVLDFAVGSNNFVNFPLLGFSEYQYQNGVNGSQARIGEENQTITPMLSPQFMTGQQIILAGGGTVVVPGPVLGTGLSGLVLAGLFAWWRRKSKCSPCYSAD